MSLPADAAPPLFLVFRPMIEAGGGSEAAAASGAIAARVARVPGVARVEVAEAAHPYWKIEGTWEFTLHVHPAEPLAAVFAALLALAPAGGWSGVLPGDAPPADGDLWAVWNAPVDAATGERVPEGTLLLPSVVWAELSVWDGIAFEGPFEDADRHGGS